jgi:hypothetical protein
MEDEGSSTSSTIKKIIEEKLEVLQQFIKKHVHRA